MTKIAWVFPGQGSQAVGMGMDLKDLPGAGIKFTQAKAILGWSVLDICQGEEETLFSTVYTQPCLYVIEAILADLLQKKSGRPNLVAGHSLGEYVALYAAGVFDFETGLTLVKRRAELMEASADGKMAALMKFDRKKLEELIEQDLGVVIANDNSQQQVVISGTEAGVDAILAQVKAKRAVTLKVSGAFHSPLMASAALEFNQVLQNCSFNNAQVPVLSNVEPIPTTDAVELKKRLARQMTGSVRWREIMQQLSAEKVNKVIEVGPGKVLTGLLKRTCPNIELENVSQLTDILNEDKMITQTENLHSLKVATVGQH